MVMEQWHWGTFLQHEFKELTCSEILNTKIIFQIMIKTTKILEWQQSKK